MQQKHLGHAMRNENTKGNMLGQLVILGHILLMEIRLLQQVAEGQ